MYTFKVCIYRRLLTYSKTQKMEIGMDGKVSFVPIVSKLYCSSKQVVLVVRRRPPMVFGGGLVVSECGEKVVFRADGCGIIGKKGEIVLRDGDGDPVLLIRRKGGIVEALNVNINWKGYALDYEGPQKLVFSLKEPNLCFVKKNPIRISTEPNTRGSKLNFEIKGDFQHRACCILDSSGNIIAQVGVRKEVEKSMTSSTNGDLYHVVVKPGVDQAFVMGIIAILDYIYDGSTRC